MSPLQKSWHLSTCRSPALTSVIRPGLEKATLSPPRPLLGSGELGNGVFTFPYLDANFCLSEDDLGGEGALPVLG